MYVLNIHKRSIPASAEAVGQLLSTLATAEDQMLATDKWPRMRLDQGLQPGSKGGHGPIRYVVEEYMPGRKIVFSFRRPRGFDGRHWFEILPKGERQCEIRHTIDMCTDSLGGLQWILAIRWLHDAYIEDAFDRVEKHFLPEKNFIPRWSAWVKGLRWLMTPRRKTQLRRV
ncbi:MAG: hypothetical protein AAF206_04265 [Bacteroidota bacterium]